MFGSFSIPHFSNFRIFEFSFPLFSLSDVFRYVFQRVCTYDGVQRKKPEFKFCSLIIAKVNWIVCKLIIWHL